MKKKIVISMGDPAGIGPELCLKVLASKKLNSKADIKVIGDMGLLLKLSSKLKIKKPRETQVINFSSLDLKKLKPGKPDKESSKAMVSYIQEGVNLAKEGKADALVTAPISKTSAKLSGFKFPGHTEFIASLTKTKLPIMMLSGESLRVTLVTIHEALKDVPKLVTEKKVFDTIKAVNSSLKKLYGIKNPRIAVAGLNPHAGEGGLFGHEEKTKIVPAIKKARKAGIKAQGPLPADTVFYRAVHGEFDVVVAMYHDQALAPLKLLHFADGVNTTLGLPIIRTSPDHGTAFDRAWKGTASVESMFNAVEEAIKIAKKK